MTRDGHGQRVRPPSGEAEGLLVVLHGRGADENDLVPLLDLLDPARRMVGVAPRAPFALPPGGAHWYVSGAVGHPDPSTFRDSFELLGGRLDELRAQWGVEAGDTVVGGFSQGAVMSYALALGPGRAHPRALVALSGFMPQVPGFDLDLDRAAGLRVAIGHGTFDPVIEVEWGRRARAALEVAGADVLYRESPMYHSVDPEFLREVAAHIA